MWPAAFQHNVATNTVLTPSLHFLMALQRMDRGTPGAQTCPHGQHFRRGHCPYITSHQKWRSCSSGRACLALLGFFPKTASKRLCSQTCGLCHSCPILAGQTASRRGLLVPSSPCIGPSSWRGHTGLTLSLPARCPRPSVLPLGCSFSGSDV